jgi:hypothetical protein
MNHTLLVAGSCCYYVGEKTLFAFNLEVYKCINGVNVICKTTILLASKMNFLFAHTSCQV